MCLNCCSDTTNCVVTTTEITSETQVADRVECLFVGYFLKSDEVLRECLLTCTFDMLLRLWECRQWAWSPLCDHTEYGRRASCSSLGDPSSTDICLWVPWTTWDSSWQSLPGVLASESQEPIVPSDQTSLVLVQWMPNPTSATNDNNRKC